MNEWKIDWINRVQAASDILDVVGAYLPIMRVGANWRAHCPFCRAVTATLYMSPQKQAYYCFSCGSGGSAFKFVMEYEGVDFGKSVELLAERFNVSRVAGWHMDADGARSIWQGNPIPGVNRADIDAEKNAAWSIRHKAHDKIGGRP